MTRNLKNFARIFPCTSDKSAVLLEKKRQGCRVFFAAQDVNISRGNKYLEATFGAWELPLLMPFPLALTVKASYRTVRKGLVMRRLCEEKALFGELVASGCY